MAPARLWVLFAFAAAASPAAAQNVCDAAWSYRPCPSPATPADHPPGNCLPYPQAQLPEPAVEIDCDPATGCLTTVATAESNFPPCNPFGHESFPGNNFLPNLWENLRDVHGKEIANTLPSTPGEPYRLHGDPLVTAINAISPTEDLNALLHEIPRLAGQILELRTAAEAGRNPAFDAAEAEFLEAELERRIRRGLDILEGMPVDNRAYSGLPLLHYNAPEKLARPRLVKDAAGRVVAANFEIHQVWYDQHIESDVALVDVAELEGCDPLDPAHPCEWTITYTVDVLKGGHDDFSPFAIYFDRNFFKEGKDATIDSGMDQTFFNMEEGTRSVFKIKMPPAEYFNMVYTWGWRMHPPRIQAFDNAAKKVGYPAVHNCPAAFAGKTFLEIRQSIFCEDGKACERIRCRPGEPRWDELGKATACQLAMEHAIGRIGDLAPEKRMWNNLRAGLELARKGDYRELIELSGSDRPPRIHGTLAAFQAWRDRTRLPCFEWNEEGKCIDGVEPDPHADLTILYVNNTIYGQLTQLFDGYTDYSHPGEPRPDPEVIRAGWVRWDAWKLRPQTLEVMAINGDHFPHNYTNVDFGGSRGWENLFKSTVRLAGSGCFFTFGRAAINVNTGRAMLCVPPVSDAGEPGRHRFEIEYNFEPSRRLRFYQFDQFQHDVAIYSIH